jgi:hypothetical protein
METITFTEQRTWRQQTIDELLIEAEPKLHGAMFNAKEVYKAGVSMGFNSAISILKLHGKV